MNIKETSLLTGISRDMIRFYEKKGMIRPKRKPENNYRDYDEHDLYLLVMIHQYSILGLSLETIRKMIQNKDQTDAIKELENSLQRLQAEAQWLQAKISSAEDFIKMFRHTEEGHSYEIVEHPELYCYRIDENGFGSMMKSIAESRGTARFVCYLSLEEALEHSWPDRRALLFSPKPYGISEELRGIPVKTYYRCVKSFPRDHTIDHSDIEQILRDIRSTNRYTPIGPVILYQVMGDYNRCSMDEVCIEIGIRS